MMPSRIPHLSTQLPTLTLAFFCNAARLSSCHADQHRFLDRLASAYGSCDRSCLCTWMFDPRKACPGLMKLDSSIRAPAKRGMPTECVSTGTRQAARHGHQEGCRARRDHRVSLDEGTSADAVLLRPQGHLGPQGISDGRSPPMRCSSPVACALLVLCSTSKSLGASLSFPLLSLRPSSWMLTLCPHLLVWPWVFSLSWSAPRSAGAARHLWLRPWSAWHVAVLSSQACHTLAVISKISLGFPHKAFGKALASNQWPTPG